MLTLEQRINALAAETECVRTPENLALLSEFRQSLNRGEAKVIEPAGDTWKVNIWVKKGILLHLQLGVLKDAAGTGHALELDTLPRRRFDEAEQVRVTAEAVVVRDGTYFAPSVTCLPPSFINMGVHVGADSVVDSNCMIGLCAFIGERVHIGPSVQIGGLISPLEALPTIIGNEAIIAGNSGIYDGVSIGAAAIVLPGTILCGHTRLYDVTKKVAFQAAPQQPLTVPPMAVVAPGAVPLKQGLGASSGLFLQTPMIVGYRDDPDFDGDLISGLLP